MMAETKLEEIIQNNYKLSESSCIEFQKFFTEINFKKHHKLIRKGSIGEYIYFIKKGAVRSYYIPNSEKTYWFAFENDVVFAINNVIRQTPSCETIELMEDSEFFRIKISDLNKLYLQNIEIANWGRKLAENCLNMLEHHLLITQIPDAKSRYTYLLNNYPEIFQRVKLGYIASYLGMSQVSLSRFRKNISL